jgi:signal transduction histidine kinase
LDVSRLQTGRINYTLTDISLNQIIKEVMSALQPIADERKLKLIWNEGPDSQVQADLQWIKQVLNNLIGNALKYTEKGTVQVMTRDDKDFIAIVVIDSGIGIDPSEQDKLFGRFRQLSSHTITKSIGSGLGLYISKGVARKMGGDIILEKSEKDKGSTFVFSIPKAGTEVAQKVKKEISEYLQIANDHKNG